MRITFDSPVILSFSFLCAGIYLLSSISPLLGDAFVLYPVWDFDDPLWYFRLFSHAMGHANKGHLMANLPMLLLLGPIVEARYGGRQLILMMLTTAIVTSILHLLFFDHGLLGASGIVFMLILLVSARNLKEKELPLSFILVVIVFIGYEIMTSFIDDGVSHFAHIIGGAVGTIFAYLLSRKKSV